MIPYLGCKQSFANELLAVIKDIYSWVNNKKIFKREKKFSKVILRKVL
jgi:hypothetical protein